VPNQIAGAVGFSVRENKVYIIKCKTMMVACGGAVNIYQPRSVGEGKGRAWYPVWNAGSTYTMCHEGRCRTHHDGKPFHPGPF
jgi:adenylylsulfate reductase subunit A